MLTEAHQINLSVKLAREPKKSIKLTYNEAVWLFLLQCAVNAKI